MAESLEAPRAPAAIHSRFLKAYVLLAVRRPAKPISRHALYELSTAIAF